MLSQPIDTLKSPSNGSISRKILLEVENRQK